MTTHGCDRSRWGGLRLKTALLTALLLALAYVAVLAPTAGAIGYCKDEGYYISAATSNWSWFGELKRDLLAGEPSRAFGRAAIDRCWTNNNEHPGLAKVLQGASHALWHDALGIAGDGLGYRLSAMVQAGLTLGLIFLLGLRFFGLTAALFSVLAFAAMPRVFFHAHLNTFDMPCVFFWLLTSLLFWRGLERPGYLALAGVFWGLSMAVRNSGVFLAVMVAVVYLASPLGREFFRAVPRVGRGFKALGWRRLSVGALWLAGLAFTAAMQWDGRWRMTQAGLAVLLVLCAAPVFALLLRGLAATLRTSPRPLRDTWDGFLMLLLLLAATALTAVYGDRLRPFNALLLLVWIALAGAVVRWLTRGPLPPLWARPILAPIVLGPLTFFLVWPWLWHDTWARLGVFLMRHLDPPAWQTVYFGQMITNPPPYPMSYPWVMWAFTIPLSLLVLLLLGVTLVVKAAKPVAAGQEADLAGRLAAWRRSPRGRAVFLLTGLLLPPLVISMPSTPVYGGTKHFMHGLPYGALCMGVAFHWLLARLLAILPALGATARRRLATALVAGGLLLAPAVAGVVTTYPYNLGYYNEVMGGIQAAPEVGMQQSFWAYQTRAILPWLNQHVPKGGSVTFNNLPWDCWNQYQKEGLARADIRMAPSPELADFSVTTVWQMYLDGMADIAVSYGTQGIVAMDACMGLPMVTVHQNQKRQPKVVTTPWE